MIGGIPRGSAVLSPGRRKRMAAAGGAPAAKKHSPNTPVPASYTQAVAEVADDSTVYPVTYRRVAVVLARGHGITVVNAADLRKALRIAGYVPTERLLTAPYPAVKAAARDLLSSADDPIHFSA